jgi:glutamate/aspartate transport system substrate-binding protein
MLRLVAVLLLLAHAAFAQTTDEGLLQRLRNRGTIVIGYGPADFPFSATLGGHPAGYAIDLCLGVVDELARTLDRHLRVDYLPVAPEAWRDAVMSGRVDLGCGATPASTNRHRAVAFSPIIFITGTKLLVRRGGKTRWFADLNGKTIAVAAGTTSEQAIRSLMDQGRLTAKLAVAPDADHALAMLRDGHAAAMAGDEVLLRGLIARARAGDAFAVVGGYLSHAPYGIMFRKDDAPLADAVGRAFARMAQDHDLTTAYNRWFEHPTQAGPSLQMPMSVQLAEMFHLLGSTAE